jgi:SAM-dependent methyltransferase
MNPPQPNFNLIARPYRFVEYVTLGTTLQNCRTHYLPQLSNSRRALILGDGDGRFLSELLARNPQLHADAVDTSSTMLQLLRQRCESASPNSKTQLRTHRTNALSFPLENYHISEAPYDLIVTHFFLDCLTQSELNTLVSRIAKTLHPGALWLISDFRIPAGPIQLPAKILVRSLYLAFRILTGLRTTHLPDHATPLTQAGLVQIAHHHTLAGILTAELWQYQPTL